MVSEHDAQVNDDLLGDLESPDTPRDNPLDDDVQRMALVAIIRDVETAKFAADVLNPRSFTARHYGTIAATVFKHIKDYGTLPSKAILARELRKVHGEDKAYLAFAGDLEGLMEFETMESPAYIREQIADYAKKSAMRRAINKFLDDSKQSGKCDYLDFVDKVQRIANMHSGGSGRVLSLKQIKELGESVNRTWVAEDWLQCGHLSVFSGREKRGKSTTLFDLYCAILSGGKWLGVIPTNKVPILLYDYENPIDYLWYSLKPMLEARGVDLENADGWLGQIHPDDIRKVASPLNAEYAIERIKDMESATGATGGLMVVDTAAPAWTALFEDSGWTNQNTSVRKALETAQYVARQTGWHVLVIYHDNKSGTGAAGSYEWTATPDCYVRFERGEDSPVAEMKIYGRLANRPEPIHFRRTDDGALQAIDKQARQEQRTHKDEVSTVDKVLEQVKRRDAMLKLVPIGEDNAVPKSSMVSLAMESGYSKHEAETMLAECIKKDLVHNKDGQRNASMIWLLPGEFGTEGR